MSAERAIDRFAKRAQGYLEAGYPILWIVTHEEQRAVDLLRRLVPSWQLCAWSCPYEVDACPSLLAALDHAARSEDPGVLVLLDVHVQMKDARVVRGLRSFAGAAGRMGRHVVVVSPCLEVPIELEKDVAVLDLPLPDDRDLSTILSSEARRRGVRSFDDVGLVRAAGGMTWVESQRAFRLALAAEDAAEGLRRVMLEKQSSMRRSAALSLVESAIGIDDVGGLDVLKGWLRTRVRAFGKDARAFGLPEPRGLMVCGVQGCGKSLVAKATAAVFGLPLVRLDFAGVFASPSPELTVRQATRMAEAIAPVVLWVDEIEKGLGSAGVDNGGARVFGDFLIWMQEKIAPVFVAATANEVEHLPPELVRRGRFDDVFFVDLPGVKERAEILAIHLSRRGRDASVHPVEALAKEWERFSGAEIEQVVVGALYRAFAAKRELTSDDLRLAGVELIPLATMYEEKVQDLRSWAKTRARRASADRRTLDLFDS